MATAQYRQEPFWRWFFEKYPDWRNVFANILLFAPFGFSVGWRLEAKRISWPAALLLTCLASGAFSFCIELTQNFMPTRTSSWVDVLANTAGGPLGWIVFRAMGQGIDRLLSAFLDAFLRVFSAEFLGGLFVVYSVLGIAISIPLSRLAMLSNWDVSYPLVLGNVSYGGRPWMGQVLELTILDRAVSSAEAEGRVSSSGLASIAGGHVVASYEFSGSAPAVDKSGHSPVLLWKPRIPPDGTDKAAAGGKFELRGPWLQSEGPASILEGRIRDANQFSLFIVCATHQAVQPGLNPILVLGPDLDRSNLSLLQFYPSLVLRVRSPLTGPAGEIAEYRVSRLFGTPGQHAILFTYQGGRMRSYVDGKPGYESELGPGAALFRHVRWLHQYETPGYKFVYYGLILGPLGCMLAFAAKATGRLSTAAIGCGLFAPAIILEPILAVASHRPLHTSNVFLGVGWTIGTYVFFRRYLPR